MNKNSNWRRRAFRQCPRVASRWISIAILAVCSGVAGQGAGASPPIRSGEVWKDTDGQPIQAHGGGILLDPVSGRYFWYGENRQRRQATGVSAYSSKDLIHWKSEGIVLAAVTNDVAHDIHTSKVLERPKVIFNAATKQYVLWLHVDSRDYKYARAGVAVSDRPTGPFRYVGSFRPNDSESRDMSVFQDDDGRAYLLHSSENNMTLHISRLSDDYLKPTDTFARVFVDRQREAPAMFKSGGKYYLITSGCTGWAPNPAAWAVSDSPMGPFELKGNPCRGPDQEKTFGAQSNFVLPAPGRTNAFIFMADRWNPKDLGDSRHVWLPIRWTASGPEIPWMDAWSLETFEATPQGE